MGVRERDAVVCLASQVVLNATLLQPTKPAAHPSLHASQTRMRAFLVEGLPRVPPLARESSA